MGVRKVANLSLISGARALGTKTLAGRMDTQSRRPFPFPRPRLLLAVAAAAHLLIGLAFLVHWKLLDNAPMDVDAYFYHGFRLLSGQLPYRDYVIEYPPLAILPFALPASLPFALRVPIVSAMELYHNAFWAEMLLADILGLALVYVVHSRIFTDAALWKSLLAYTLGVAAVGSVMVQRYDIIPALLTLLGLYAFGRDRPKLTGLFLALGVAAKLYPLVVAPVLIIAYVRQRAY